MFTLVHVGQPRRDDLPERERFLAEPAPRLPQHAWTAIEGVFGSASLLVHLIAVTTIVALASTTRPPIAIPSRAPIENPEHVPLRFVFLPQSDPGVGGGGGGGGNRQDAPIPRAQAIGRDALTLPAVKPVPIAPVARPVDTLPPIQAVSVDAVPLASGMTIQVGTPHGVPTSGTSQGPGSGGGVGTGTGTGIGSGRGPGIGPGSGGGIGGGVYRPGGGVAAPTLVSEVRPTYTPEAMRAKVQGLVLLDVVVQRDGIPGEIKVLRSLDPGLDQQAILAVRGWRFNPGRLNGAAVDVLVTIELTFRIY